MALKLNTLSENLCLRILCLENVTGINNVWTYNGSVFCNFVSLDTNSSLFLIILSGINLRNRVPISHQVAGFICQPNFRSILLHFIVTGTCLLFCRLRLLNYFTLIGKTYFLLLFPSWNRRVCCTVLWPPPYSCPTDGPCPSWFVV